jgi:hypothetical protein
MQVLETFLAGIRCFHTAHLESISIIVDWQMPGQREAYL